MAGSGSREDEQQTVSINQLPTLPKSSLNPIPTSAKVAVTAKPVRVNPTTLTGFNDLNALSGEMKGRNSKQEPETRERTNRTNLRLLKIPAPGLVVEERLLDIEAQAILAESLQASGLIADNRPEFAVEVITGRGQLNRAEPLTLVNSDVVKAVSLAGVEVNVLELPPALAISVQFAKAA